MLLFCLEYLSRYEKLVLSNISCRLLNQTNCSVFPDLLIAFFNCVGPRLDVLSLPASSKLAAHLL